MALLGAARRESIVAGRIAENSFGSDKDPA